MKLHYYKFKKYEIARIKLLRSGSATITILKRFNHLIDINSHSKD